MPAAERDREFMARALELARRGRGRTSPNPAVGCVLAADGRIVGEGWHRRCGGPHAEAEALAAAGAAARGATAYVTLMPCNHHGKTPPCTEALLRAGVKRVVAALADPNPVSSGGTERLRAAGVAVDLLPRDAAQAREAAYLMRGFLKELATGLPFLKLKMAMTLDGRTATRSGDSRWISSAESRQTVQAMRAESDAVLVGIGTARADDPRLNVRDPALPQPRRVIVDPRLELSPEARLFREPGGPVIVVTAAETNPGQTKLLEQAGASVLKAGRQDDCKRVDLAGALAALAALGVREALCEGGAGLAGGLFDAGLIDEVAFFVAPKLAGGAKAPGLLHGTGVETISNCAAVRGLAAAPSGADLLLTGKVGDWSWFPSPAEN